MYEHTILQTALNSISAIFLVVTHYDVTEVDITNITQVLLGT